MTNKINWLPKDKAILNPSESNNLLHGIAVEITEDLIVKDPFSGELFQINRKDLDIPSQRELNNWDEGQFDSLE